MLRYFVVCLLYFTTTAPSGGPFEGASQRQVAKNVILLIGDGMGLSQVSLYAQEAGTTVFEEFPVVGFQKTHSSNNLITDSAASATAMASGVKTTNSAVGVDATGERVPSILELGKQRGYATGVIATASLTHATPGAFLAHQALRGMFYGIANDIAESNTDLLIGGGRQYFLTDDGTSPLDLLRERGYRIVAPTRRSFQNYAPAPDRPLLYLTAPGEPATAGEGRSYLPAAVRLAGNFLSARSEQGFLLMAEGSQIDWALHKNDVDYFLEEMQDFEQSIAAALEFARRDGNTLVLVTADHETGGLALNKKRRNSLDPSFTTKKHTAVMVPVFAYGPGSELFGGIYDNTEIFTKLTTALAWNGLSEAGF